MMRHTQETQVNYGAQEVGRRQGTEEMVVIWTDSYDLTQWFESDLFDL